MVVGFIDIAEMLPKLWVCRSEDNPTRALAARTRGPVIDLRTRLKAFVTCGNNGTKEWAGSTRIDGLYTLNNLS